jgi:hypothetical protein
MRLTLMADELSLIVGEIRGVTKALTERLDRQDAETIRNKEEAIAAREAKHAENLSRFQGLDEKVTTTFGLATVAYNWVTRDAPALHARVDKIDTRVKAIEDGKTIQTAEERGSAKTWAYIGVIATALGTALGTLLSHWRDAIDFLKGLHHGG